MTAIDDTTTSPGPDSSHSRCSKSASLTSGRGCLTVLVIGATGTFGERLVRHLVCEHRINVIPGARREAPLRRLASELGLSNVLVIDRETLDAATLKTLAIDVVVDASGPFQLQQTTVIRAAIDARVHYLDLADSREFVAGIGQFDEAARQAKIVVISGASSTPALSHAVLDTLCAGWRRIDSIAATICPSNRQSVGLAVVRAILSTVGQPVQVFDDGRWVRAHGWGRTRRFRSPGIGRRYASLVATPDLDLFVSRYRPRKSAVFEAGLGLAFEHLTLAAIGALVRVGLLRSATPLARPLHWIGNQLRCFGVDVGIMEVRAIGLNGQGLPIRARWRLTASGQSGPHVPVLAAVALLRHLRDGTLDFIGATPCVGILPLDDFAEDLARLGISTTMVACERQEPTRNSGL